MQHLPLYLPLHLQVQPVSLSVKLLKHREVPTTYVWPAGSHRPVNRIEPIKGIKGGYGCSHE